MEKREYCTASIEENKHCNCCGWPVVFACCNGNFTAHKDAGDWDFWVYCSNKGCKNHDGEGLFQSSIGWISKDK